MQARCQAHSFGARHPQLQTQSHATPPATPPATPHPAMPAPPNHLLHGGGAAGQQLGLASLIPLARDGRQPRDLALQVVPAWKQHCRRLAQLSHAACTTAAKAAAVVLAAPGPAPRRLPALGPCAARCPAFMPSPLPSSPVEVGAVVLGQLILALKVSARGRAVEPAALLLCRHGSCCRRCLAGRSGVLRSQRACGCL